MARANALSGSGAFSRAVTQGRGAQAGGGLGATELVQRHRRERAWMLQLIRDGLRVTSDTRLLARQHVLPLLMTFFDCAASADEHDESGSTRSKILSVLERAANVERSARCASSLFRCPKPRVELQLSRSRVRGRYLVESVGALAWLRELVVHATLRLGTTMEVTRRLKRPPSVLLISRAAILFAQDASEREGSLACLNTDLLARAVKLLCKLLAPMHGRAMPVSSTTVAPDDPDGVEDVAGAKYHIAFEYELSTRAVIMLLVEMSKHARSRAGRTSSTRARATTVVDAALEYIEGCCYTKNKPTWSRGTAGDIGLSLSDAQCLTLLLPHVEDADASNSDRRREAVVAWFVAWHVDITSPTVFAGETDASAPAFALSDLVAWAVAVLGKTARQQASLTNPIDANRVLAAVLSLVVRASLSQSQTPKAACLRASKSVHPRSSPLSTSIRM